MKLFLNLYLVGWCGITVCTLEHRVGGVKYGGVVSFWSGAYHMLCSILFELYVKAGDELSALS